MIRQRIIVSAAVCCCIAATALDARAARLPLKWQQVGTGITGGVSGMAVARSRPDGRGSADLVVVRDNKKPGESRVATVRLRPGKEPVTKELTWRGSLPEDLEAIDAVPGRPGHYIALASRGTAYEVVVKGKTATVHGSPVGLPGKAQGDNYESFALWRRPSGGGLFAVWATRGKGSEKAVVRAAPAAVDRNGLRIGTPTVRREFAVPFPNQDEVRHISDLKILADGTVLVSSASDPNVDDGPFSSAVYKAGRLSANGPRRAGLNLRDTKNLSALRKFTRQDNRKIEAIAFLPRGSAIWGTDDENHGGYVGVDQVGINRR
ncbi:hypothetical protein [Streptomyces roseifaciens]|uniref:hypothetical protein n=1 Tax=Streptomyces roseifaciens TaxID=1488406 RepID=UPI001187639D|nr:hypothetical protein [Streptomyces roseifaciens]